MKQIASNYAYSPATNVVTLTGVNIDADQLLLIVAPQVGRTMYNFASGVTGVVSAGADTRVSLNASTAGLTTTSPLVIFYEDQSSTQTISGTVTANVVGKNLGVSDPLQTNGSGAVRASLVTDSQTQVCDDDGNSYTIANPFPVSGTVTANVVGWDGGNAEPLRIGGYSVGAGDTTRLALEVTGIDGNPIPISGTVTANNPSGALTTRFGSVATANLAFITSAVTNTSRKYLLAQNISAGTVTIGIGFSPTTTQGIQLTAGGGLTFDAFCPTGAVYWLGAVTGAAYTILEG